MLCETMIGRESETIVCTECERIQNDGLCACLAVRASAIDGLCACLVECECRCCVRALWSVCVSCRVRVRMRGACLPAIDGLFACLVECECD